MRWSEWTREVRSDLVIRVGVAGDFHRYQRKLVSLERAAPGKEEFFFEFNQGGTAEVFPPLNFRCIV